MPEQDLARIAFVTRRFADLQGLRAAGFGAMLVIGTVTVTLLPPGHAEPLLFIALPAQNAMFALSIVLNGYYQRRFGRVPSNGRIPTSLSRPQWDQSCGLFIVVAAISLDLFKSLWYPGGPSHGAAAVVAYSLWIVWRDWPHRFHHVIGVFAGLAAIVISASVPATH